MTAFDNSKVQSLFLKLKETEGYEARKEIFNEIIGTVQNQTGRVQGNDENGILGGEYKSSDQDGHLVTCSIVGSKIDYQRTSTRDDKDGVDDGVLKYIAVDTGAEITLEDSLDLP